MRQADFKNAFNVGELGPDGWSRGDLAQHSRGCVLGWNMIGRVMGPMGRRNGTWFCGHPKTSATPSRLVPFRRNSADALLLELGHLTMRVWTVNGAPVLSAGLPYERTTPWTAAQLAGLRWRQVGDAMFFTHRDGLRPQTLRRFAPTDWALEETTFVDGPYLPENAGETHNLSLTGTTLLSDQDFFRPGHVGALFRLRTGDGHPGVLSWEPGETGVTVGVTRLSNGRVYEARTAGTAGNTPPVHESGEVSDGGVNWKYLHDGAGVVKVTSVTSGFGAVVQLIRSPPSAVSGGTRYWSEGAYSDLRGWPTAPPAVREERLVLAGGAFTPDRVDFTRTAGYRPTDLDFKPGLGTGRVVDDDAVRRFVGDEGDRIVWLAGSTFLMAGTTAGEFLISGGTVDDPIAPSSIVARPLGEYGSADVMPVLAHDGLIFTAAGAQDLRFIAVAPDQSKTAGDLTYAAPHITGRGVAEITWMKQPHNLLWVRLADGGQASMSFHAEQNVIGWNRHGLAATTAPTEIQPLANGMVIESSCVVPGVAGRPRLFMIARRDKGGVPQRLILRMAEPEDRLFLDAAEAYAGAATNSLSGLDHLTGETITVMAATEAGAETAPGRGWGQYRDRTVSGAGGATLPEGVTATAAYAGLPFLSRWEGLPPELAGPGSTTGRKVRYTHAQIVVSAAVARIGTTGAEGDSGTDRLLSRRDGDIAGPVVRRQTWRSTLLGGAETEKRLFVETDDGWDLSILALRALADVD